MLLHGVTTLRVDPVAMSTAAAETRRTTKLSIVIPVYRGEKTIERLVRTLFDNLGSLYPLEIVLVNDGSPDDSATVCRRLAGEIPSVKFLNLSRNFSEHNAVMAGLNYATGDYVAIMDDDFQNPPGEVVKLVTEAERGFDVVYSYYAVKKHHPFRNLGSRLNNWAATLLLDKPRICTVELQGRQSIRRAGTSEVRRTLSVYRRTDPAIHSQLFASAGRPSSASGRTLRLYAGKLVALWLNMFTNFSVLPLRLASLAGFWLAQFWASCSAWGSQSRSCTIPSCPPAGRR